jgi:hypothetical protein
MLDSVVYSTQENLMAGHTRKMEGDETQRRQAARDARAEGKRPSEVSATLGASKQGKEAKRTASHAERVERLGEGKRRKSEVPKSRPGSGVKKDSRRG